MRARQQAGHMDASDLIKSMQRQSCKEGAVHIWGPDADRRAKPLIHPPVEGSLLLAYSHSADVLKTAGDYKLRHARTPDAVAEHRDRIVSDIPEMFRLPRTFPVRGRPEFSLPFPLLSVGL